MKTALRSVLAFAAGLAAGGAMADPLDLALVESRAFCAAEGGVLEVPEGAVTEVDINNDGVMDAIVSEEGAFCGPNYGFLGGSGGHMIHAVIGDQVRSWLAGAWMIQDIAFTAEGEVQEPVRMLLLARHGSACNSYGVSPCIEAVTWDGERLISIADDLPDEAPPAEE